MSKLIFIPKKNEVTITSGGKRNEENYSFISFKRNGRILEISIEDYDGCIIWIGPFPKVWEAIETLKNSITNPTPDGGNL